MSEIYSIPANIPIYTAETLLSRNSEPFKPLNRHRPGTFRSKPGHLHPNKPRPDHTAFLTRLSIRVLRQNLRRQAMRGATWHVYYRDEYVVAHYEYAICAIAWNTCEIQELMRFTTRKEALHYLANL